MERCETCRFWEAFVPQNHSPPSGLCRGNRLHVYPGWVYLEHGHGQGASDFQTRCSFGCVTWQARAAEAAEENTCSPDEDS